MGDFNITDDAEAYKILNNSELIKDSMKNHKIIMVQIIHLTVLREKLSLQQK